MHQFRLFQLSIILPIPIQSPFASVLPAASFPSKLRFSNILYNKTHSFSLFCLTYSFPTVSAQLILSSFWMKSLSPERSIPGKEEERKERLTKSPWWWQAQFRQQRQQQLQQWQRPPSPLLLQQLPFLGTVSWECMSRNEEIEDWILGS